MTKIINLFGGPGSGKSTTAAGLFYEMKIRDIKCELVTEYAKDMTYEKRSNILEDQLYILAKQNRRLSRLLGVVDYIITDSPLPLGLVYAPANYYKSYAKLTLEIFNSYDNCNFLLNRVKPYQIYGRNQTEEEAKIITQKIDKLLKENNLSWFLIDGDKQAPINILSALKVYY